MKTKFESFCYNRMPEGCKRCLKGEKLVLFITGICSRNCRYCSLSDKRKGADSIWANERKISTTKELIQEAKESKATSAGITGGDPLACFQRTLRYAKALKKAFKNFHIHIYLPPTLLDSKKLKKLSKVVDEIRFHPSFLARALSVEQYEAEIEKIKLSLKYFKKRNLGIELPIIPNKKKEILQFIKTVSPFIGFVNLNEFEISDTNFSWISKNYKLNPDTYTIKGSQEAGIWIIQQVKKANLSISIHVCTARTKNWHQYLNRIKKHEILPYGRKTKEGTVVYYAVQLKKGSLKRTAKRLGFCFIDKRKSQIIISPKILNKAVSLGLKVKKIEEYPTFDREETLVFPLN